MEGRSRNRIARLTRFSKYDNQIWILVPMASQANPFDAAQHHDANGISASSGGLSIDGFCRHEPQALRSDRSLAATRLGRVVVLGGRNFHRSSCSCVVSRAPLPSDARRDHRAIHGGRSAGGSFTHAELSS